MKAKDLRSTVAADLYNNKDATVMFYNADTQRWNVKFDHNEKTANLKAQNLDVLAWNKYDDLL